MAFLRMSAVVRWNDGMDKVNVRLRRDLAGRWLATVLLPQLLLVSPALLLELQLATLLLLGVSTGVVCWLSTAVFNSSIRGTFFI